MMLELQQPSLKVILSSVSASSRLAGRHTLGPHSSHSVTAPELLCSGVHGPEAGHQSLPAAGHQSLQYRRWA